MMYESTFLAALTDELAGTEAQTEGVGMTGSVEYRRSSCQLLEVATSTSARQGVLPHDPQR